MTDLLWHVTLAECREELLKEEQYGYGLIKRKIKKFLPYNRETFDRHRELYYFWLDMYSWKLLHGEGFHWPIRLIYPRWEMEIALDWWRVYFSYKYQGAKRI